MSAQPHILAYGDVVEFSGGKYNGFNGYVAKIANDGMCSVIIDFEGKSCEVVEHFRFFKLMKAAEASYTHDTDAEEQPGFFGRIFSKLKR